MKLCKKCNTTKALEAFPRNGGKPHNRHSVCKDCKKWQMRVKRYAQYGTNLEEVTEMLVSQGNRCAICECSLAQGFAVDHCHKSVQLRGVLCVNCNAGIGMFKDSPMLLQKAIKYLR